MMENIQDPKYCSISYLEREFVPDSNPQKINIKLKTKYIPIELKEKFLDQFKEDLYNITGNQIDKFLEDNKL